jgi:hypothetical protein
MSPEYGFAPSVVDTNAASELMPFLKSTGLDAIKIRNPDRNEIKPSPATR